MPHPKEKWPCVRCKPFLSWAPAQAWRVRGGLVQSKKPPGGEAFCEAENGTRTHDHLLGKQELYQLSYFRDW